MSFPLSAHSLECAALGSAFPAAVAAAATKAAAAAAIAVAPPAVLDAAPASADIPVVVFVVDDVAGVA